jgi:general stress protein 26
MASKKLSGISNKMRKIDICMLTTRSARGVLSSRPMSNNGDVAYDGNSYFFTWDGSGAVRDIEANAQVHLGFEGPKKLYISVSGSGKLIRSRARMEPHWIDELEQWFKEGIDTSGLVMIHVKAGRIKYWQGADQGEIKP